MADDYSWSTFESMQIEINRPQGIFDALDVLYDKAIIQGKKIQWKDVEPALPWAWFNNCADVNTAVSFCKQLIDEFGEQPSTENCKKHKCPFYEGCYDIIPRWLLCARALEFFIHGTFYANDENRLYKCQSRCLRSEKCEQADDKVLFCIETMKLLIDAGKEAIYPKLEEG